RLRSWRRVSHREMKGIVTALGCAPGLGYKKGRLNGRTSMRRILAILVTGSLLAAPALAERSELGELQLIEVAGDLEHPWSLAFLPDGQGLLVTERPGRLRWLDGRGRLQAPLAGLPQVYARGQGGLLEVALSPQFPRDRLVYLSYAEADAA